MMTRLLRSVVAVIAAAALVGAAPVTASAAGTEITPGASAVTASTDDGNVPANVVDKSLSTRWSGDGDGAWLQLDLGSVQTVSQIKVAVYHGDQRQNVFQLQYWDGSAWVTAFDGMSSGTTTGLETYNLPDVQTSKVRYVGHGYVSSSGNDTWNSLTEVEVWSGGGTSGTVPANILDLTNWKETLPIGPAGDPTEILQPQLATYSIDPYFKVNAAGDGVQFRAPVNGTTTGGSSYPRSELREMNGSNLASWSTSSGTHTMTIDEAITATPLVKPHIVAGQVHGSSDDVLTIRLEGTNLFVDHNGNAGPTLTSSYALGTRFTVQIVASGGHIKVFYNGVQKDDYSISASGNYFKAGAYTQANCGNSDPCDASNYGEVNIYGLTVSHS